jgi:hypothetical protein
MPLTTGRPDDRTTGRPDDRTTGRPDDRTMNMARHVHILAA